MSVPIASPQRPAARGRSEWMAVVVAVAVAVVAAAAVTTVVVLLARAVGVAPLPMFAPGAYLPLTVVGVVAAGASWQIIRRRARNPRRVLTILAPIVLVASVVPDILLGLAGIPVSGVLALIVMHAAVGAAAVPAYARLLPLHQSGSARRANR